MAKSVAVYTEEHPVADHRVNEWFEQVKEQEVINFSNNTQYLKLRLEHAKGNIDIDHFDMNGEVCRITERGGIDNFPEDLLNVSFNLARELAKLSRLSRTLRPNTREAPISSLILGISQKVRCTAD